VERGLRPAKWLVNPGNGKIIAKAAANNSFTPMNTNWHKIPVNMNPVRFTIIVLLFCCVQATQGQQAKKKIERSDQLPVHSYSISGKPSSLFTNDAALATLAASLEKDLESDLRDFDIQDKATLRGYYASLQDTAFFAGRYDDALSYLRKKNALQDKPVAKAMAGLFEQPVIDARKAGTAQANHVFEAEFAERLKILPFELVQDELKSAKGSWERMSTNLLTGFVEDHYDTLAEKTRSLPKDAATDILGIRLMIRDYLPYKDIIVSQLQALLDAHKLVKKDIWGERAITLSDKDDLKPVVIAIWDSGVDPSVFPGKMWVNKSQISGNGKDNDGNGYVDGAYGIAWDWYGKKSVGPLRALDVTQAQLDTYKHYASGSDDMQANLDTPASAEFKKKLSTLQKDDFKPFFEGLMLYGKYSHGTHVAGIALAGNPAGRVMVIRMEFPVLTIPPPPNQEWADGWVAMFRDSVRYLRDHGARTVNMSWDISAQEIEGDMQASGSGGTVEERHATAGRFFKMLKDSLVQSIQSAPDVLFIAAAGNDNNDARFSQDIPSAIDLPNTMTVGAVDKAGDETSFTSYGKVGVYANGSEVDSVVPGGDHQSRSGTSMAAPQVTGLAAKLFAKYPQLTALQVKKLILDGADEKEITGRKIRLLNPKRSFELAGQIASMK